MANISVNGQTSTEFAGQPNSIVSDLYGNYDMATYYAANHKLTQIYNPDEYSRYYTGSLTSRTIPAYLEIDIKDEGLEQNDPGDIVVYIRRHNGSGLSAAHPTGFKVMGLFEGDENVESNWKLLFYVQFLFRGIKTKEYSSRIPISNLWKNVTDNPYNPGNADIQSDREGKKLKKMRFYVISNTQNSRYEEVSPKRLHEIDINAFDVLKLAPGQNYSSSLKDNYHLTNDYYYDFENFKFTNTRGIVDNPNTVEGWSELTAGEKQTLKDKKIDVVLPDFDFLTSETNKLQNPYPINSGEKRQPTHTVEHIIYAMPGDIIPLIPYYNLADPNVTTFHDNFSHWYDFKTGGRVKYSAPWDGEEHDLLDFLTDPYNIQKSEDYGFFGGKYMNTSNPISVKTVSDYIEAVEYVNNNHYYSYISIDSDLDFTGYTEVPMIGPTYNQRFRGIINGNGHTISNLIIDKPEEEYVGIISRCADNAVVQNIIIDKTCRIRGKRYVGPIGYLANNGLFVYNLSTEATVIATDDQAAGILGWAQASDTFLNFKNCYVGGEVGSSGQDENAAVVGWIQTKDNTQISKLENVVVNCKLYGSDNNTFRCYIRSTHNSLPMIYYGNGVKGRGNFRFKDCHAIISENTTLEPQDECWQNSYTSPSLSNLDLKKMTDNGWQNSTTPPMEASVTNVSSYPSPIYIGDEEDYIYKISSFNQGKLIYPTETITNNANKSYNAYFVLTQDLDFIDYGPEDVPMIGTESDYEFGGIFNGAGHSIKNLRIIRNQNNVGLFGRTRQGVRIENLIIESSCIFDGNANVGLIGNHRWDPLIIRNVKTEAIIRGSGANSGGILGISTGWSTNVLQLENVYVGGVVGNKYKGWENGAISGWISTNQVSGTIEFKNVVVNCLLYKYENTNGKKYIRHSYSKEWKKEGESYLMQASDNLTFKYTNCFGNIDPTEAPWQTYESTNPDDAIPVIKGWTNTKTPPVKKMASINNLKNGRGLRTSGTVATFYCPRNPYTEEAQSLPFDEGEDEYVIAADFSQTFDPNKNIDENNQEILEPIIATRHIFRIRDGKKFADDFSESVEKNKNYIRRNRKYITARAGVPFQMALDFPMPLAAYTNYYYKTPDGKYSRTYSSGVIRKLDGDTRTFIENSRSKPTYFELGQALSGQGIRTIDGVDYVIGDGNADIRRMLLCNNPEEGHFIVQIYALNDASQRIEISGEGSDNRLYLMEYDITFLPVEGASMVPLARIYKDDKWKHTWEKTLREKYGDPAAHIDFDEYIKINRLKDDTSLRSKLISYTKYKVNEYWTVLEDGVSTPTSNGMEHTYFKWPLQWRQSDYSFGYNDRQDFGVYVLATHSDNVPYKEAAKVWNGNAAGDGTGLYDISYYKMLNPEYNDVSNDQGYFYYVNASSDPGVSARLNIDRLCQGSTIVVSAWMAEFSSTSETVNLSFNFVAVMPDDIEDTSKYPYTGLKNGERVVLHKFITGYIPGGSNPGSVSVDNYKSDVRGEWVNIYYSFVPRLAEFSNVGIDASWVDHYELELDNNDKSSSGADYGIDDIQCYVVPPTVDSEQLTIPCINEDVKIRLASPFETLLEIAHTPESLGDSENGGVENKTLSVFYTFVDKDVFDKEFGANGGNQAEALKKSIIKFSYNNSSEGERKYGTITFNSNFNSNEFYKKSSEDKDFSAIPGKAYAYEPLSKERLIVFESEISETVMRAGKEYYVIFKSAVDEEDVPAAGYEEEYFDLKEPCSNSCVTYVKPANIIKVNGEIRTDSNNIRVCENQSPVIQVNINGRIEGSDEIIQVGQNAYFDWFYGSLEYFESIKDTSGIEDHTLKNALSVFRSYHLHEESVNGITPASEVGKEDLEQWMLDLIEWACTPSEEHPIPLLTLYRTSFVMPPLELKSGDEEKKVSVVVIPIECVSAPENYLVCSEPTPLNITVGNSAPILKHGLSGVTYPDNLTDVPLRIGLDQLRDGYETSLNPKKKTISIPVRTAASTDASVTSLKLVAEEIKTDADSSPKEKEGCIILVQTNDPEYKDLGTIDADTKEDTGKLLWIGEVTKLVASTSANATGNYFNVTFHEDFKFKEGFFYTMRFQYEEAGGVISDNICKGEDVFTLKIVPKYLQWTGGTGLNWNNDNNWRRMKHTELYMPVTRIGAAAHYITDGFRNDKLVNDREDAYSPLDFTHVVIGPDVEAPYLYAPKASENIASDYGLKDVEDKVLSYSWPSDPEKDDSNKYTDDPGAEKVGAPTAMIKFDMAAFDFDAGEGPDEAHTGCRPWYANTCKEIHFKPRGTIMNQQELSYKKAWVDVEASASRWYILSSPLKEVYAGDFYLPTDGGRQETELFKDITFRKGTNDRFKPAVFQRGWDKSAALVYELENQSFGSPRNVAVKTFWSHVYNDVTEEYGGGTGFSIKNDVSRLSSAPEKVMFRLPKADPFYEYYNQAGNKQGHKTTISRSLTDHHRLNDSKGTVSVTTATAGQYFLVGNPFMTHLDIKKFLLDSENSKILEPVYWIVTEKGQIAGTSTETGSWLASASDSSEPNPSDPTAIAPMQGFFVKTKDACNSISLRYDETMMRRYNSDGSILTETTRGEERHKLKISSENYGIPSSAAVLMTGPAMTGQASDVEAIDNRDLDVLSTVYTVKDGKAMSINFCSEPEGMEIGVIADENTETLLRFEGAEAIDGLMLLDKADQTLTPLEEGTEIRVVGPASGRFFLTRGMADEGMMSGIEWLIRGDTFTATDNASSGCLEVTVHDILGRIVKKAATDNDILSIQLNPGIFVVEMRTAKERETAKIQIVK